jgi:hypothetical protein
MKNQAWPFRGTCALLLFFMAAVVPHVVAGQSTPVPENQGFLTVSRIMGESCLGCHEWAGSYRGIADPARIFAGSPAKSLLFLRIAKDEMPPSGEKLGRDSKLILRAWLAAGGPAPSPPGGQAGGEKPPYPAAAANDPAGPVPEPCPCGLD